MLSLPADLPGVDAALALVDGFDDALVHGFARLGDDRLAALSALAGGVSGTALGAPAAEAVGKITAGSVDHEHLTALAAARTAVLGAVHDAIQTALDSALARSRPVAAEPAVAVGAPVAAAASWLHELAITGWRGVDHDLVSGFGPTLDALLTDPAQRRLAVLLDGLAAELRASCPVGAMAALPTRRWADLWTRAVLLAHAGPWVDEPVQTVSGRLLVLGVDVHEHATAVQAQVHAVLESGGTTRLVRATVGAAKTDTIVGQPVWRLLGAYPTLLAALAKHVALEVREMPLRASGDLVWLDDKAAPADPVDPFATARLHLAAATAAPAPPLDRHPVRIAEPVLVEGDCPLEVAEPPSCGPVVVDKASAIIGLVRWDGRWVLQPLAVQTATRRGVVAAHNGDWALGPTDPKVAAAQAKAGDAVAVLRERASRLLRT